MNSKYILLSLKMSFLILILSINTIYAQTVIVNPSPAYFGQIPIGSSDIQNLLIVNNSLNTINISNITISGESADKFSIVDNPAPLSLGAFAEIIFSIEYTPYGQAEDIAILQIEAESETMSDTIRGSGTTIYNGTPTFERLIGTFDGNLDVGGVWTFSLDQAPDGGFVIVGTTTLSKFVTPDVYLIKTDKYGKQLWYRTFEAGAGGGSYDSGGDQGWDALPLNDGNILVLSGGNSMGPGGWSIILSKWDSEGNIIWETAYGGIFNDIGFRIIEDYQGNVIISGSTNNTADQTENAYVLKVNPTDGSLTWAKNFGENGGIQSAYDIVVASDGGFVFVGNNQQHGETANIYLTKIDDSGSKIWSKTLTSKNFSEAKRLQRTSDGSYIAAGYTLTDDKGKEGYLVKVNADGDLMWEKSFGTDHPDYFSSVVQMPDNGYLSVGAINQFWSIDQSYDDLWLLKTDADGSFIWEKRFGGEERDAATEIIQTAEGGYAIVGMTESFTIESRVYFLQVNADGVITKVAGGNKEAVPEKFGLLQNYPNPFNPATTIEFSLPQKQEVTLKVYDLLGREVATLVSADLEAGVHRVTFDASNLPSGVYIYRLQAGEFTKTKNMVFIK